MMIDPLAHEGETNSGNSRVKALPEAEYPVLPSHCVDLTFQASGGDVKPCGLGPPAGPAVWAGARLTGTPALSVFPLTRKDGRRMVDVEDKRLAGLTGDRAPAGEVRLSGWLDENRDSAGGGACPGCAATTRSPAPPPVLVWSGPATGVGQPSPKPR